MKNFAGVVVVGVLCVVGCKKKDAPPAALGSEAMGSATTGMAPETGSGTTIGSAGSGMAAAGSDAVAAGSAGSATGSAAAGAVAVAPAKWDCTKACKLVASCKSKTFHSVKECETDCTKLENDTDGRYARGSIEGVPYYTCVEAAKDCAAVKKCEHP